MIIPWWVCSWILLPQECGNYHIDYIAFLWQKDAGYDSVRDGACDLSQALGIRRTQCCVQKPLLPFPLSGSELGVESSADTSPGGFKHDASLSSKYKSNTRTHHDVQGMYAFVRQRTGLWIRCWNMLVDNTPQLISLPFSSKCVRVRVRVCVDCGYSVGSSTVVYCSVVYYSSVR